MQLPILFVRYLYNSTLFTKMHTHDVQSMLVRSAALRIYSFHVTVLSFGFSVKAIGCSAVSGECRQWKDTMCKTLQTDLFKEVLVLASMPRRRGPWAQGKCHLFELVVPV